MTWNTAVDAITDMETSRYFIKYMMINLQWLGPSGFNKAVAAVLSWRVGVEVSRMFGLWSPMVVQMVDETFHVKATRGIF